MKSITVLFDGPEGVGKTSQVHLCATALEHKGLRVLTTRINGGTPIGESLRAISLAHVKRPVETDFYMIQAMTAALIAELANWRRHYDAILIDRSPLSLIAYQVYGGGLDKEQGFAAAEQSLRAIKPDLLICYQATEAELRTRRHLRDDYDYYEAQHHEYHGRTIKGYQEALKRIQASVIDASGNSTAVHKATMKLIEPLL